MAKGDNGGASGGIYHVPTTFPTSSAPLRPAAPLYEEPRSAAARIYDNVLLHSHYAPTYAAPATDDRNLRNTAQNMADFLSLNGFQLFVLNNACCQNDPQQQRFFMFLLESLYSSGIQLAVVSNASLRLQPFSTKGLLYGPGSPSFIGEYEYAGDDSKQGKVNTILDLSLDPATKELRNIFLYDRLEGEAKTLIDNFKNITAPLKGDRIANFTAQSCQLMLDSLSAQTPARDAFHARAFAAGPSIPAAYSRR